METSKAAESLKTELFQAQKTRDQLMKWKLLLVSGIGSAALGFSDAADLPHAELALCLIPFACAYTDLLCRNLSIRTKLLSAFLSAELRHRSEDLTVSFERFYGNFNESRRQAKRSSLEGFALRYSTLGLCVAVVPVGILASIDSVWNWSVLVDWRSVLFFASGIAGVLLSLKVEREYQEQKELISKTAMDWKHTYDAAPAANPALQGTRGEAARP